MRDVALAKEEAMVRKWSSLTALAVFAMSACGEGAGVAGPDVNPSRADGANGGIRTYEVTLENLTSGQPLSPGVIVTHTERQSLFGAGDRASEGIRLIAENGDPSVAVAELSSARGVFDVLATTAPVGCIGCGGPPFPTSMTVRITSHGRADRLSLALMLICTNDGFAGLQGVRLPPGFAPHSFYAAGYDAGTEANDERFTSIVDPCGDIGPVPVAPDGANDRPATDGVVRRHPGILGGGDLGRHLYGWRGPVLKVTIQQVPTDVDAGSGGEQ